MKKLMSILGSVALVCLVLTNCSSQPSDFDNALVSTERPKIVLCVDINPSGPKDAREFLDRLPGCGREFDVELELLSEDQAKRSAQITRVRTEIMAGKGPDVFICYISPKESMGESLFRYPEKSMLNRVFLPLDEYIAKAQYMKMDELLPVVMEAGKGKEGQMVLPLSYELNVMLVDTAQYTLSQELPSSWEEMLTSQDPILAYAASSQQYSHILGYLADFEAEELNFTEEELLAWAQQKTLMRSRLEESNFRNGDCLEAVVWGYGNPKLYDARLDDSAPVYTAIPPYNLQGGVTASVTTFAAINRNTQNPDTAFLLLDVLLSKQTQQNSEIYSWLLGMPTHMDLGKSSDMAKSPGGFWYMNEGNYQNYLEMRDKINVVKFRTPLDDCLDHIQFRSVQEDTPLEKIVQEEYATMRMMLGES